MFDPLLALRETEKGYYDDAKEYFHFFLFINKTIIKTNSVLGIIEEFKL